MQAIFDAVNVTGLTAFVGATLVSLVGIQLLYLAFRNVRRVTHMG